MESKEWPRLGAISSGGGGHGSPPRSVQRRNMRKKASSALRLFPSPKPDKYGNVASYALLHAMLICDFNPAPASMTDS